MLIILPTILVNSFQAAIVTVEKLGNKNSKVFIGGAAASYLDQLNESPPLNLRIEQQAPNQWIDARGLSKRTFSTRKAQNFVSHLGRSVIERLKMLRSPWILASFVLATESFSSIKLHTHTSRHLTRKYEDVQAISIVAKKVSDSARIVPGDTLDTVAGLQNSNYKLVRRRIKKAPVERARRFSPDEKPEVLFANFPAPAAAPNTKGQEDAPEKTHPVVSDEMSAVSKTGERLPDIVSPVFITAPQYTILEEPNIWDSVYEAKKNTHSPDALIASAGTKVAPEQTTASDAFSKADTDTLSARSPGLTMASTSAQKTRVSTSFVSEAVKRVGPCVVRVDSEKLGANNSDDPFGLETEKRQGQGSGFIISTKGEILTNCHVVDGADKVTVTLTDGRKYLATVKGVDEMVDLAVIKIDTAESLPVAPLANSDELGIGDWVIALGNPIGLDNTVTLGIVSNLKRSSSEIGAGRIRSSFIQTDAAINPGNSGGPLVNEFGEVVGINTAVFANAEGIGFAIPINKAKQIMGDLAQGKHIEHPYIGIAMVTITPEYAKQFNMDPNVGHPIPEVNGAMVVLVQPDGPAGKGGLRRGDVLLAVDDQPVRETEDGQRLIDESKVGQKLKVTVLRGGQKIDVSVQTEDLALKMRSEKERQKKMESALEKLLPKLFQIPEHNDEGNGRIPGTKGNRRHYHFP